LRSGELTRRRLVRYSIAMTFEQALKDGELDTARAILDELVDLPDTGGLWLPECYGDLAQSYDRRGRHDDAIAVQERAIALGWGGRPDPRSDIAEFHLRAGRAEQAAAVWAELKAKDPDDVWLYNAAGLSYNEVGDHELAVAWLAEGLELAMRTEDPEGIAAQLSDVRRRSLEALGRELDELEHRVDEFVPHWRARERKRDPLFDLHEGLDDAVPPGDAPLPVGHRDGEEIPFALAWFPAGEYERAIERWPDLAKDWAEVPHCEYCRRIDGHIKWMRAHGVPVAPSHRSSLTSTRPGVRSAARSPRTHEPATPLIASPRGPRFPGRLAATRRVGAARTANTRSAAERRPHGRCTTLARKAPAHAQRERPQVRCTGRRPLCATARIKCKAP
jgi:hypothetical protein